MNSKLPSIEIGWIPYLNLVPFYSELRRLAGDSLNFVSGHPSVVNKWLMDGVVDLAPASSVAMLNADCLKMALPLGIASEGPVQSVYIGLHREHEDFWHFVRQRQIRIAELFRKYSSTQDIPQLAKTLLRSHQDEDVAVNVPNLLLTPASAASVALSKILLHLWCGRDRAFRVLSQAKIARSRRPPAGAQFGERPMELVIGDEALERRVEFWKILDLGQIWYELTRLPFVFGLWQTRSAVLPESWSRLISDAADVSQARMRVEPEVYFGDKKPVMTDGSPIDLRSYWSVIQYKLNSRHFSSLLLYYNFYQQVEGSESGACVSKLMAWNKSNFFDLANAKI